ncbi:FAD binding domain-containing protein [Chenggangzhangella methanolivorans]|uniref:FAD binding domain-containing protein n=1 Tax=Chenggangzhangella methanolivorans TaxID=1437009 RepID=UPI0036185F12
MRAFDYLRACDLSEARRRGGEPDARLLAGGTTLLDLMKCGVERPSTLVDIGRLDGLDGIEVANDAVRIGGLARMSRVADHPGIREAAPALSESLWQAASPQIRNMATVAGNVLQRTRCTYFRDVGGNARCNKRSPGSGCAAIEGIHRNHAILGTSDACIATYPGDLAVALVAFDASLRIEGPRPRSVRVEDFIRLPGDRPDLENDLAPAEVVVSVEIPVTPALRRSRYLKVRDRASYEFAAASAAVGLDLEPDGRTIRDARVALGGVATRPWRARNVEAALRGRTFDEATVRRAAALAVEGAQPLRHNAYKAVLAPRVVARALIEAETRA